MLDDDITADMARDMNLLPAAVGDPVLNYLGASYGTGLGSVCSLTAAEARAFTRGAGDL